MPLRKLYALLKFAAIVTLLISRNNPATYPVGRQAIWQVLLLILRALRKRRGQQFYHGVRKV